MAESFKQILLAEDEIESRLMIDLILHLFQCRVDFVEDGLSAVKQACAKHYDCILMDLGLPKLNGIYACAAIHSELKARALAVPPIVALTEYAEREKIDHCIEVGITSILFKPLKAYHFSRLFMALDNMKQQKITLY